MTRSRRRRKPRAPSRREQALLVWLTAHMGNDHIAARDATLVAWMHKGLIEWMDEAELARVFPKGALDGGSGYIAESRDPDDRMLALVEERLEWGGDPEHLDPVRQHLVHRLGDLASWYVAQTSTPLPDRWEPLAVYLGDLIGDQVAANAIATCILGHHYLAINALSFRVGMCHTARQRWNRLAVHYVRVKDEQPSRGRVNSTGRIIGAGVVGGDDMRRFG